MPNELDWTGTPQSAPLGQDGAVMQDDVKEFAPCHTCGQYSHSIGKGQLADAHMHFYSMIAHPVRGHPMGSTFDAKTRDMAQMLVATIARLSAENEALHVIVQTMLQGVPRKVGKIYRADCQPSKYDQCDHGFALYQTCESCVAIYCETALKALE